jgi:hypothetical protein
MPLVDDPQQSLLTFRGAVPLGPNEETNPTPPPKEEENLAPSFGDQMRIIRDLVINPLGNETTLAALRSENTIGSAIAKFQDMAGVSNDLVDPNYSPWEDVVGTKYEQYWKGTFAYSNNRQYTQALKRSIDRQENDRRTVDAGGAAGVISGIVAGTVDPTILLPVGGEVKLVGKGVWTVGRGALAGARAGGIGTAAYELGLQSSQDIRSGEESAINIGTGVVLGAVLGGSLAGVLAPHERIASERGLEAIADMPVPGSVGAAAPHRFTLDDMTINGTITANIAKKTAYSPNLRGNFREAPLARQTYQELATNTLRQAMHEADVPLSLGPSVETNINVSLGETLGQALEHYPGIFREAKKAGVGMSADAFDNAVGVAMRREDIGPNDFVSKAAALWRKQVIEPLSNQAIKLGLLPEDVTVTEAPSYFSRMYNVDKMTANKPQFMDIATAHFGELLQQQYVKSVQKLKTRQQTLAEEAANLKLGPEERLAKLQELEGAQNALAEQFPTGSALADQIKAQREIARKARSEGDTAGEAAANSRIDELKQASPEFQQFKNEEAKLKKSARQVNLGYGGMQSKADAISQQLTDLTASNFRSLSRLVKRGQTLAKELQRLDPEKLRTKVSDLRSEFYGLVLKSERAQDRLAKQLEKLRADENAKVASAQKEAGVDLSRRDRIKAATTALEDTAPGEFRTVEVFPNEEPGYHRFRYVAKDGTAVGGNYTVDGNLIEGFNIGDKSNPVKLGPAETKAMFTQLAAQHPEVDRVHALRTTGARGKAGKEKEVWIALTDKGLKTSGAVPVDKAPPVRGGEAPDQAAAIEKQVRGENTAIADRLERALKEEQSRTARLSAISDRLQAAEAMDSSLDIADVKTAVDELTQEISNRALGRGETAAELLERLSRVNPAKVDERLAQIEQLRKDMERKFFDQWEVKRLGEGVDLSAEELPDFSAHAKDMAQEVYDAITGNDYGSASVDPGFNLAARSGPLKDRTFHIPDEKIEPFLENNVVKVMTKFARSMSAQIELARKFPDDPLLKGRFQEIKNQYDTLINHATTEKERVKLQKDMKGTFRDLRAMLEIHRGSYMAKENASSWGRTVRGLMNFNYLRSMGGAALPSVSDVYGPAVFHGLGRAMSAGVPHLMQALSGVGPLVKEAKYAGVAERLAHHRLLTLSEIGDPYAGGTAIERMLQSGTHVASKWNGLNLLTDFEKNFDAIIVQDRMNNALLKGTDDKFLAYSGMGPDMRTQVAEQLRKYGDELDGITVANTDQWDDFDAVRAYRAAINFNTNADIVTRGIGDVPLFAYTPLGKALLQFKTFNLAAHQRTFLRAMQLGPAQFLSGLMGLTTIGMFATVLRAWRSGDEGWERFKNSAKNPGYMIGEGVDATGFFTLPIEISNITEKATARAGYAVNPVKTPLLLAGRQFNSDASIQANSQSYAGQHSLADALGGPTVALMEDAATGPGGVVVDKLSGRPVSKAHRNATNRIIPYQSYLGMREMLQMIEGNSPYIDDERQ